jgi:hypothetical protein
MFPVSIPQNLYYFAEKQLYTLRSIYAVFLIFTFAKSGNKIHSRSTTIQSYVPCACVAVKVNTKVMMIMIVVRLPFGMVGLLDLHSSCKFFWIVCKQTPLIPHPRNRTTTYQTGLYYAEAGRTSFKNRHSDVIRAY